MAQTTLNIKDRKLVFRTHVHKGVLNILISSADDNYLPIEEGTQVYEDLDHTEEEFHKDLRLSAEDNKHLVRQYSTDPQWNPQPKETPKTDE